MAACSSCGATLVAGAHFCGTCGRSAPGGPRAPGGRPEAGRQLAEGWERASQRVGEAWRDLVGWAQQRPGVAVALGAAVVVALGLIGFAVAQGTSSNGLAGSYTCTLSTGTATVSFTNTGDAQGKGLAGNVVVPGQGTVETFRFGQVRGSQVDFGVVRSYGGNEDPFDLTYGGSLERGNLVLASGALVCTS